MLLLLLPSKATMNNAIECRQIRQNMSFSTGHMPANLTSTRVCVLCLTTKMLCCAFRCAAFQFLCKSIRPKLYVPASAHADDMIWHDVTLAHTGCQLPTHPILFLFLSLSLSLARQEQQRVPCETVISIIVGRNGRCPAVPQHTYRMLMCLTRSSYSIAAVAAADVAADHRSNCVAIDRGTQHTIVTFMQTCSRSI